VEVKEAKTMSGSGMTGKKAEVVGSAPGDVKAILGKGSEFEGKLRFDGTARIDGKFKGEIMGKGTLVVGQGARIEADIQVDSLMIGGDVRGAVDVRERMEIDTTGKFFGNIKTSIFIIHEGGLFEGSCQMAKGMAAKPAE
jgi:cytoskeletal protein CcmA (bactofilin family)